MFRYDAVSRFRIPTPRTLGVPEPPMVVYGTEISIWTGR